MINKLVFENVRQRPVRSALSILAVGLEVTMILTIVGLSDGMLSDSAQRARGVGADIWIKPPGASVIGLAGPSIPEKMIDFLDTLPHVAMATGNLIQPIGGVDSVTGIDLAQFNKLNGGFTYLRGGPFKHADDIIVDEYYARQKDVQVGSTIKVLNRPWHVAGVVAAGKLARIVVPLNVLQDLTGNTGKLSQVLVKLDNPRNLNRTMALIKQKLPGYQVYSVEELTSLFSVNNVPALRQFIVVIIGLAMVVGFLVVFLSMYTAVLERTREIGILKSLGASAGYVLNIVLRETALLAVIGWALGVGLSYGTRALLRAFAPASLIQAIVPHWWPIAAAIAIAGAMIGAAYPGWRAARQDPIEALSYE